MGNKRIKRAVNEVILVSHAEPQTLPLGRAPEEPVPEGCCRGSDPGSRYRYSASRCLKAERFQIKFGMTFMYLAVSSS